MNSAPIEPAAAVPSSALARLTRSEVFPGVLLAAATALALGLANSPWAHGYEQLWETPLRLQLGTLELVKPVQHWINDGLMVLFFFFVGLELKHEVLDGQLRSLRQASLPIAAAIGGMLLPAALYTVTVGHHGDPAARAGWGIPMATDIAFALGVLALLGPRIPSGLKVFLATLAIVDDLGAVLVIACFYTDSIRGVFLLGGLGILLLSWALNRVGVRKTWPYVVCGLLLWLLFLNSGVHATIAGVALALTIPARRKLDEQAFSRRARELIADFDRDSDPTPRTNSAQLEHLRELQIHTMAVQAPLQRMEHGLGPVVRHVIVPLFALANAGVAFDAGFDMSAAAAQGVAVGLLLGKPLGVMLACLIGVRLLKWPLPVGVSWRHLHGAAWLAGIGFTMSLFVDALAFPPHSDAFRAAKIAILIASAIAGTIGFLLLLRCGGSSQTPPARSVAATSQSS